MSTKTLRKRIALVAVSAMGFGLLTSVAANAVTYAAYNAVPAANEALIGKVASATGSATPGTGATLGKANAMTSVGFITTTSTQGTAVTNSGTTYGYALGDTGDTAGTAVVYSGAKISVALGLVRTTGTGGSIVVTGGTLSAVEGYDTTGTAATTPSLNGTATTAMIASGGTNATSTLGGVFTVSAAAGSTATVSFYTGANIDDLTSATNGALVGTWTFTVASASASGTYSAADSTINTQTPVAKGTVAAGTNAYDYGSNVGNGKVGLIYVALKDAYSSAITTGTLAASATNSATLKMADATSDTGAEAYAATSSYDSMTPVAGIYVYVNQPVANTAGSTTVSLSLNGSVIATKTINWSGVAASISLDAADSASIFNNATTITAGAVSPAGAANNIVFVIKDAAGNVLDLTDFPTITDQTGSMVGASLSTTDQTHVGTANDYDSALQTAAIGYGTATMAIPSSTLNGAGTYTLKYVNSAGTTIKSAVINATVSGAANTFTATWDKPSYNPGDIASLKLTVTDSKGNPVADGVALGTNALVTTNTDGLASVTSACDAANIATATLLGGSKTCKFAVKNTAGSYAFTAYVPTASAQAASAGTVKIVDATTSVTNAEVLAAIVKLIASINKQIAALQKALKK